MSKNNNQNQQINNLIWAGTIVNTHALNGELRVLTNNIDSKAWNPKQIVYYQLEQDFKPLTIKQIRFHKNFLLLKFENLNFIDQVMFLKGKRLYVEKQMLDADDFYYEDVIGYQVYENNQLVGTIVGYFDQKAYYSFEVKTLNDAIINIPILDEIIIGVNHQKQRLEIDFLANQY